MRQALPDHELHVQSHAQLRSSVSQTALLRGSAKYFQYPDCTREFSNPDSRLVKGDFFRGNTGNTRVTRIREMAERRTSRPRTSELRRQRERAAKLAARSQA